eukprot:TRINITY_DN20677_c0_g1_i1.p1 TRINITY_DN20677_c0_g1~~TRINITY_DN20677_c0_g1_i1.p1  ORF type:complete len:1115 (-),score=263.38 TRINITY_DN20677_c0_g1_i1:118-3462(-)
MPAAERATQRCAPKAAPGAARGSRQRGAGRGGEGSACDPRRSYHGAAAVASAGARQLKGFTAKRSPVACTGRSTTLSVPSQPTAPTLEAVVTEALASASSQPPTPLRRAVQLPRLYDGASSTKKGQKHHPRSRSHAGSRPGSSLASDRPGAASPAASGFYSCIQFVLSPTHQCEDAALLSAPEKAERLFRLFDADEDGRHCFQEVCAFLSAVSEQEWADIVRYDEWCRLLGADPELGLVLADFCRLLTLEPSFLDDAFKGLGLEALPPRLSLHGAATRLELLRRALNAGSAGSLAVCGTILAKYWRADLVRLCANELAGGVPLGRSNGGATRSPSPSGRLSRQEASPTPSVTCGGVSFSSRSPSVLARCHSSDAEPHSGADELPSMLGGIEAGDSALRPLEEAPGQEAPEATGETASLPIDSRFHAGASEASAKAAMSAVLAMADSFVQRAAEAANDWYCTFQDYLRRGRFDRYVEQWAAFDASQGARIAALLARCRTAGEHGEAAWKAGGAEAPAEQVWRYVRSVAALAVSACATLASAPFVLHQLSAPTSSHLVARCLVTAGVGRELDEVACESHGRMSPLVMELRLAASGFQAFGLPAAHAAAHAAAAEKRLSRPPTRQGAASPAVAAAGASKESRSLATPSTCSPTPTVSARATPAPTSHTATTAAATRAVSSSTMSCGSSANDGGLEGDSVSERAVVCPQRPPGRPGFQRPAAASTASAATAALLEEASRDSSDAGPGVASSGQLQAPALPRLSVNSLAEDFRTELGLLVEEYELEQEALPLPPPAQPQAGALFSVLPTEEPVRPCDHASRQDATQSTHLPLPADSVSAERLLAVSVVDAGCGSMTLSMHTDWQEDTPAPALDEEAARQNILKETESLLLTDAPPSSDVDEERKRAILRHAGVPQSLLGVVLDALSVKPTAPASPTTGIDDHRTSSVFSDAPSSMYTLEVDEGLQVNLLSRLERLERLRQKEEMAARSADAGVQTDNDRSSRQHRRRSSPPSNGVGLGCYTDASLPESAPSLAESPSSTPLTLIESPDLREDWSRSVASSDVPGPPASPHKDKAPPRGGDLTPQDLQGAVSEKEVERARESRRLGYSSGEEQSPLTAPL